jgi:hypothetical protein
MGQSRVHTLLLVAPPYVVAAGSTLAVSRMSDRIGDRAFHIICPMGVAIAGYVLAAITLSVGVRYLSLFLMLSGVYGSYNVALAWISSTVSLSQAPHLFQGAIWPCNDADNWSAPSTGGEEISSDCHHQYNGQCSADLLAVFLSSTGRAALSVGNGCERLLLCRLHWCDVDAQTLPRDGK